MAKIVGKPNADDVKRVAVAALVAALDDGKENAKKKPGLTGMRAVATGAVLYTAGKVAFNGRRFISERLQSDNESEEDEAYDDDEEDLEEDDEESSRSAPRSSVEPQSTSPEPRTGNSPSWTHSSRPARRWRPSAS